MTVAPSEGHQRQRRNTGKRRPHHEPGSVGVRPRQHRIDSLPARQRSRVSTFVVIFVLRFGVLACLVAISCSGGGVSSGGSGGVIGDASVGGAGGSPASGTGGAAIDAAATDTPGSVMGSGGAGGTGGAGPALDASVADGGGGADGGPAKTRYGMKSAGCGKTPMGANSNGFTNHRIALQPCAACTIPNCPKDCIAPPFAPGGRDFQMSGNGETLVARDFSIQLPPGYDPTHAYPVFYGGAGCGAAPPITGSGFEVPGETTAIRVGLQQVSQDNCFADGGIRCARNIANVADCKNG